MNEQEIIAKYNINPDQRLDVFYDDGWVWSSDDEKWVVIRCGEMRVDYKGERLYTNSDFIKVGLDTDDKVAHAEKHDELDWHMNPWFVVAKADDYDNEYGIYGDIVEAIAGAMKLMAEEAN
jgi:hypothetical protein